MAENQAFARLPGESAEAYRAFGLYRDLGPRRSLLAVTRLLAEQNATTSAVSVILPDGYDPNLSGPAGVPTERHIRTKSGRISEWSRRWNWVERARDFDDHVDRAILRKTISTVEQMAERHARQNEQVLGVLMIPFVELAKAVRDPLRNDLNRLPASDLLKATIFAARHLPHMQEAERIARGVRVISSNDPEAGTQGPPEFRIDVYQPPRPENAGADSSGPALLPPEPAFRAESPIDDDDD